MACEMIISFFIYGKLDYWNGYGPRFNKHMRNILNLNGSIFRFAETFRGLSFTNAINLTAGELRYTGQLLVGEFVSVGITDEENRDRLSNCLEILASNGNNSARLKEVYQVVSEIIWEEILVYAEKKHYKMSYNMVSVSNICTLISLESHYAISSKIFVRWILRNASLEQEVVRRIIEAVKYIVGCHKILQEELQNKIESEMWKNGKALLYPADEIWKTKKEPAIIKSGGVGRTLVVLPCCGVGNQKFSTATDDIKKMIASQYRQCHHQIYKSYLTIPQVIEILAMAENYIQTDEQSDVMVEFFRQMLMVDVFDQVQTPASTAVISSLPSTSENASSLSAATNKRAH